MSETTSATLAADVTPEAETIKVGKATVRKPAKKAAKASANGKAGGLEYKGRKLRSAQVRILAALAKAKNGLGKAALEEKAQVNPAWLYDMAGRLDKEVAQRAEASYGFPSLYTLGLCKPSQVKDETGEVKERGLHFELTAAGRKLLGK